MGIIGWLAQPNSTDIFRGRFLEGGCGSRFKSRLFFEFRVTKPTGLIYFVPLPDFSESLPFDAFQTTGFSFMPMVLNQPLSPVPSFLRSLGNTNLGFASIALGFVTLCPVVAFFVFDRSTFAVPTISHRLLFWGIILGMATGFAGAALGIVGMFGRYKTPVSIFGFVLNVLGLLTCIYSFSLAVQAVFPM